MTARGHVAHLTSVHPPYDRRINVQCASLAEAGWTVSLVAKEGRFEVPGVEHLTIPPQTTRLRRMLVSSWHVFRHAYKSGANVCHFHDPELLPVGMLLSLLGRRVVYDVHEDMPLQILNKPWLTPLVRRPIALATAFVEWVATRALFSAVVAATPPIARRFAKHKTVTVQNFPEIAAPSDNQTSIPPLAERPFSAVHIGNLDENRGVREIVQALGHAQSGAGGLILAGRFSSERFEAECRALPNWSQVEFRGWLDRKQISQALADAKVGLVTLAPIPNYIESYPTKLFEYMAAGIPVVASDFPLWRSIVDGAGCGLLVNPQDPAEIAKAIDWLIEHPKEAAKMGADGQRAALETYNWRGESAKLRSLYERF